MRPPGVFTGIVFGTCLSIAVSLAAVDLEFLILDDEYPRLDHEFRALINRLVIFNAMTAISAMSFYWIFVEHQWRHAEQLVLCLGSGIAGHHFLPSRRSLFAAWE